MAPVFGHGRLRLYLLKLLEEAPRHGYEVIRLLEERFQGLYAPSAGTVYPRLAKLEAEGLVTHATEGGRKVYSITDAGRAELAGRRDELADLELEIHESVSELAAEIREDVRGSARDLREELRTAARQARRARASGEDAAGAGPQGWEGSWGDKESWKQAKEEWKRAKQEMKEQAHRAKEESRRAKEEARQARRAAQQAQDHARDEVLRIKQRVQEQMQAHLKHGDWPTGVIEGIGELTRELASLADPARHSRTAGQDRATVERDDVPGCGSGDASQDPPVPEWARGGEPSDDPARDLERLLDRFRDDVRDAARDNGVTAEQLKEARRHLSTAAARIGVVLRGRG